MVPLPGSTIGYYANDLAHQQTVGGKRQTWQLDAALRFRSWKVEVGGLAWTGKILGAGLGDPCWRWRW
ncbi:hypothetical protein [Streptomyces sp. NPDC047928]|uniref:hypothetical protein n=1 Tax=unclassified Streptomyces TaxID=2593676 RepID=UPI003711104A